MEIQRKSHKERLLEQKRAIEERLKAVEAREREEQRRFDTRRKILAGAVVLEEAEKRPEFKQELDRMLERFLFRPNDRKLFGLNPALPPGTVVDAGAAELIEKVGEAVEEISRVA